MSDHESPQEVVEPEDKAGRTVNVIILSAFGATSALAVLAIVLCLYLLNENAQDAAVRACVRKIDLYVAEIRDDINTTGWDALVARTEGSPNVNVQEIARRMRADIDSLKSQRTRDMRNTAVEICETDPNFEPR